MTDDCRVSTVLLVWKYLDFVLDELCIENRTR